MQAALPIKTAEFNTLPSPEKAAKIDIPVPGIAPIPDGNIRLFHFTYPEMLESIRSQGLTRKNHEISSNIGLNTAPDSIRVYANLNLKEPPGWTIGKPYLEFSAELL